MGKGIVRISGTVVGGAAAAAAPNVGPATVAVSFVSNGNASSLVAFSGTVTLPTPDPAYSHLKQIKIGAVDASGNQYAVTTVDSSSWSGSPASFAGISAALQPASLESWSLVFTSLNEAGSPTLPPYTLTGVSVAGPAIASVTAASELTAQRWSDGSGALHVAVTFAVTAANSQELNATSWIAKQGTCNVTGGVNIQSTAGHTFANYDTGIKIKIGSQWSVIASITDSTHAVLASAVSNGTGVAFAVYEWIGWWNITGAAQVITVGRQGDNPNDIFSPIVSGETWQMVAAPGCINASDSIPASAVYSSGFTVAIPTTPASTVCAGAYVDALTYGASGGGGTPAGWGHMYCTIARGAEVFAVRYTVQTGAGTGGSFVPGGAHPNVDPVLYPDGNFHDTPTSLLAGQTTAYTEDVSNGNNWLVPVDGNNTWRIRVYAQNQAQASSNPPTWTLQACWSAGVGISTPGTVSIQDLVVDQSKVSVAGAIVSGAVSSATTATSVTSYALGAGVSLDGYGKITVNIGSGLTISGSAVTVKTGNGISVDGYGNVTTNLGNGLAISGGQVVVNASSGLAVGSGGLYVPASGIVDAMITGVGAAKLTAGTLAAGVIYAGSIACTQIATGTLAAGVILASNINASQINAGTLAAGVVYAGSIACSQIAAGTISAAISITSPTINGGSITGTSFSTTSGAYGWTVSINPSAGNPIYVYNGSGYSVTVVPGTVTVAQSGLSCAVNPASISFAGGTYTASYNAGGIGLSVGCTINQNYVTILDGSGNLNGYTIKANGTQRIDSSGNLYPYTLRCSSAMVVYGSGNAVPSVYGNAIYFSAADGSYLGKAMLI